MVLQLNENQMELVVESGYKEPALASSLLDF